LAIEDVYGHTRVQDDEAFAELRAARPDLKLTLLSGHQGRDLPAGLEQGELFGFLHKPYELLQLLDEMNCALGDDGASAARQLCYRRPVHATPAPLDHLGRCLVTGGAGFLAGHIVRDLLGRGHDVRSIDIREPNIVHPRLEHVPGDLRIPEDVEASCEGIDTVFHTAAVVDFVGFARPDRRRRSVELNVGGTENVIAACRRQGVSRLVYTSSNNVLLGEPIENATGDSPYPAHHVDLYSETKTAAERLVLAAHEEGVLSTVALRPGGIYGVGDPFYLPQLLEKIAQGLLVTDIGDGTAMADNTFVGNLVHGEILAARHLAPGSRVGGRAYYITDGEPTPPMEFFRPLIEGLGHEVPTRRVPYRLMSTVGYLWELMHRLHLAPEPMVTRLHAMKAALSHSGSIEEARRDFGYEPIYDWREALERCIPYCREVLEKMQRGHWP
jgi:3beta-hydroxy-delta5-steroid dehydrogenase/steroid delta-isomerase